MGRGGVRRPLGSVLAESPGIGDRDSIPYSGNLFASCWIRFPLPELILWESGSSDYTELFGFFHPFQNTGIDSGCVQSYTEHYF